ncbi:MAG: NERD domain-containing protein [Chloroflexaceae bacterium]
MAVQVWIGEKPEHPNERRAIMALAQGLDRLEGLYLILANFSVGGRTIDLVIVKHDAVFIIELKQCDGRVIGSVNGPWFVEGRNGERKRLNPGRKNPYNQVISYFHALTNYLNEHRSEFLPAQKINDVDFRTCKRVVVIAPSIQEGSEIELDWKVELKGMDELPAYVITERSSEIELTEEEMLAIPQMLRLTPWQEINTVLRGVISDPDLATDPAEAVGGQGNAVVAVEAAPRNAPTAPPGDDGAPALPAGEPATAETAPPRGPWQRALMATRSTTGRLAVAMAVLAAILALALLLRPTRLIPVADAPPAPLVEVTGVPPGSAAFPIGASEQGCLWAGYQVVAKRFDTASGHWRSIAEGGSATAAQPEVVVALERISTCDGAVHLTWSVQNNSDRLIELPLDRDNIRISDGLGNEYLIDDDASEPSIIRVAPGAQERGVAIVNQPLNSSATTLHVRLKDQPFGEASFVVALQR